MWFKSDRCGEQETLSGDFCVVIILESIMWIHLNRTILPNTIVNTLICSGLPKNVGVRQLSFGQAKTFYEGSLQSNSIRFLTSVDRFELSY